MKAVLLSLKPEWWEKMLSGEKTLEVRKTCPKQLQEENQFTVYVYVSGTGKIQGGVTCWGYKKSKEPNLGSGTCLTEKELSDYGPGQDGYYRAWCICNPEQFVAPLPLSTFGLHRPPQSWCYTNGPTASPMPTKGGAKQR